MKKLFPVLVVLCFCSCRKKEKEVFPGLTGTWIGIGNSYSSGSITPPDAFYSIKVQVINENNVLVFGDTLPLATDLSNDDIAVFNEVSDYNPGLNYRKLVYHKRNRYVEYSSSAGSSSGHGSSYLSSAGYHPNPSVKDIVKKLAGIKVLSGTVHEKFYYPVRDTTYDTSIQVTFSMVNDSTVAFNRSVSVPGGDTLHYKLTGTPANTVTFEVFHLGANSITTLVYNIATGAVVFREWKSDFPRVFDVELN